MKKRFFTILTIFVLVFCSTAYAHSGKTDSNGGHYDYNNVSGLGSYHYHHGYPAHLHVNDLCPCDDLGVKSTFSYLYAETCAYKLVWLANDVSRLIVYAW